MLLPPSSSRRGRVRPFMEIGITDGHAFLAKPRTLLAKARTLAHRSSSCCSLQIGIFRLGLLEYGNIRVGGLPQQKEVLVGYFRLGVISGHG
jgi:hypothetical protein